MERICGAGQNPKHLGRYSSGLRTERHSRHLVGRFEQNGEGERIDESGFAAEMQRPDSADFSAQLNSNLNKRGNMEQYLRPTAIMDSDHPAVRAFADTAAGTLSDPVDQAVALYLAVRDSIWYDPYAPFYLPEHYQASFVLKRGRSFCIPKAALLCAAARARRIPARLGFATVKNHLATKQLLDYLGSDLFVFHGFTELHLNGRWVKATPAFNRQLCERHRVPPLEFNGRHDSLFQPYNADHQQYMEYVAELGTYEDVPVAEILDAWNVTYGSDRVAGWIQELEQGQGAGTARFETEEVWQE